MRNAILPTCIFALSSLALVWFESRASIEKIKSQDVSVMQFDQESYEKIDKDKDDWLSSIEIQKQKYEWVRQFRKLEKLIINAKFLALNKQQRMIARIFYAKHMLDEDPKQSIAILSSLTPHESKIFKTGFSLGLGYSRLGKTQLAIAAYRNTLVNQPNHQGAAINLGLLLKGQKEYQKAINVLQRAVGFSSGVKLAKVYSLLANCQEKLGYFHEAQLSYQKSIEYRPQHAASWLGLARMQQKNGDIYEEVIKNFQRAHRLNPNHFRPLFELGNYQLNNLDFSQAVKNLQLAVELVPLQQKARRSLAWALFENQQLLKAKKQWLWLTKNEKLKYRRKFAKFMVEMIDDGENVASVESLTRQILNKSKISDSLKNEFEYLLLLSSVHPQKVVVQSTLQKPDKLQTQELKHLQHRARWHKAKWYRHIGLNQQALAELKHLRHQPLALAEVDYKLSEIYGDLGELEQAHNYIDSALLYNSKSPEFLLQKIKLYINDKNYPLAQRKLSQMQRRHPSNNKLAVLAAEIAWQTNRLNEAKILYEKLVKLEHNNDIALYRLASIAHKQGDLMTAKLELNNALLINSELVPARFLLAKILCEQGELKQCKYQANKVLKLDNNHQQAKQLVNI